MIGNFLYRALPESCVWRHQVCGQNPMVWPHETSLSALLLGPVCLVFFKKFKKERVKFYLGIKLTIKDC